MSTQGNQWRLSANAITFFLVGATVTYTGHPVTQAGIPDGKDRRVALESRRPRETREKSLWVTLRAERAHRFLKSRVLDFVNDRDARNWSAARALGPLLCTPGSSRWRAPSAFAQGHRHFVSGTCSIALATDRLKFLEPPLCDRRIQEPEPGALVRGCGLISALPSRNAGPLGQAARASSADFRDDRSGSTARRRRIRSNKNEALEEHASNLDSKARRP